MGQVIGISARNVYLNTIRSTRHLRYSLCLIVLPNTLVLFFLAPRGASPHRYAVVNRKLWLKVRPCLKSDETSPSPSQEYSFRPLLC